MSLISQADFGPGTGGLDATPAPASLGPEARGAERFTLLVRTAKLVIDGRDYLCVLRDASSTGVKVRLFHAMPPGGSVALELSNGERHPMQMRWNREDHAGFEFDTPIDVKALIDDRGHYPKRPIRAQAQCEVVISALGREFSAVLRNISQQGLCLESSERLMLRQAVRVKMPGFPEVVARVCWRDHPRYGMVFEYGFGLEELARMLAHLQGVSRKS